MRNNKFIRIESQKVLESQGAPFLTHAFPTYAKHLWLKQLLEETQGRKLKHCESKLQKERLLFTKISSCPLKKTCRTRTIQAHCERKEVLLQRHFTLMCLALACATLPSALKAEPGQGIMTKGLLNKLVLFQKPSLVFQEKGFSCLFP